jgi:hypothetical protein
MIVPPDWHEDQRLVTHKLTVRATDVSTERSYDTFGNVILDVSVDRVEDTIDFTAWIVLERETNTEGGDEPEGVLPDARLLEAAGLTEADAALRAVAEELRAGGATGLGWPSRSVRACTTTSRTATASRPCARRPRRPGRAVSASARTTPTRALALLRVLGPARPVRLRPPARRGRHARLGRGAPPPPRRDDLLAAHAFDPTHDRRTSLRYLTVALGRDYADVPPTSGTFEAPWGGELTTHKRAAVTRVEYLRPRRRRRAVAGGR